MAQEGVVGYLKRTIQESGMIGKLIAINVSVSLLIGIFFVISALFTQPSPQVSVDTSTADPTIVVEEARTIAYIFIENLGAPVDPAALIKKPWTIVTQLFTHYDFFHLLFNMVMLFFAGRMFVHFFGGKRLLTVYLVGGVFAYLIHVIAFYSFPMFQGDTAGQVFGASGAIYAIFTAIVIHRPTLKVQLLFIPFGFPIFVFFILFILGDFRGIISNNPGDNVAHFAHIGGAIFGALSIINLNSPKSFMNRLERFFSNFKWPSFKRKPKMKVHDGGAARAMTDDEYNSASKAHQDRIDAILDKISKKGYEGLTKEEKDILFNESKRKK